MVSMRKLHEWRCVAPLQPSLQVSIASILSTKASSAPSQIPTLSSSRVRRRPSDAASPPSFSGFGGAPVIFFSKMSGDRLPGIQNLSCVAGGAPAPPERHPSERMARSGR